jgi:hypothetical protein
MSSSANRNEWPREWKDQYNKVLRARKSAKSKVSWVDQKREESLFPQIWQMELNDEAFFSYLAYSFPLDEVLSKLLQKFIGPKKKDFLKLSWSYLEATQKVTPVYYSERERIVVLLNRFKSPDRDWDQLFNWLSFSAPGTQHPYAHLFLGVLFLDHYLRHLDQEAWLIKATSHLKLVERTLELEECIHASRALLAFSFYLKREYASSLSFLDDRQENGFDEEFRGLIQKQAS